MLVGVGNLRQRPALFCPLFVDTIKVRLVNLVRLTEAGMAVVAELRNT